MVKKEPFGQPCGQPWELFEKEFFVDNRELKAGQSIAKDIVKRGELRWDWLQGIKGLGRQGKRECRLSTYETID